MKLTKAARRERDMEQKQKNLAAVKAVAGLSAGLTVAVVGVACLAAVYCKKLMDISYLAEEDIYEE